MEQPTLTARRQGFSSARLTAMRGSSLIPSKTVRRTTAPDRSGVAFEEQRGRDEGEPPVAGALGGGRPTTASLHGRAGARACTGGEREQVKISAEFGRAVLPAAALLLLLVPQRAAANEPLCAGARPGATSCEAHTQSRRPPPDRCVYGGDHKPHTRNLLGSKALFATSLATTGAGDDGAHGHHAEGPATGFGVSIFYERELVPRWLEVELNVGLIDGAAGLQVPIDLLLKKPFHLGRRLTPYIGIGPSIELFPRGDRSPLPGVTGGVGLYLWLSRDFGLDLELDYTAHFLSPGIEHVNTLGLGPVLHF